MNPALEKLPPSFVPPAPTAAGGEESFPDPLAALLGLLVVVFSVVSFGKYDLFPLFPYFLFPLFLLRLAPARAPAVVRRTLLLMPLAVLVGAANPFLDTLPRSLAPGLSLPGGWISFTGILVRFLLCVGSALALTAAIPFAEIVRASRRAGLPAPLTSVLLFLWRYLSLLLEEAGRMGRARAARAGGRPTWRSAAGIIGNLFLRTLDRADRIHQAMLARGFHGPLPSPRESRMKSEDWAFLALCAGAALGWRLLAPSLLPSPEVLP